MQASEMTLEQHVKHVVTSGPLRDLLLRIVKECKPVAAKPVEVAKVRANIFNKGTVESKKESE